jgi:glycosyltransferase involved in cell wall biosynthesis
VVAVAGNVDTCRFSKIVKYQIKKDDPQSYIDAADMLNKSDIWGVSLQHEYGIFGGPDGEYVLDLIDRLEKPVIATLHTVLSNPGDNQKRIIQRIGKGAAAVVVMVDKGKDMLMNIYGLPESKIHVIPHGVPNIDRIHPEQAKKAFNIQGRPVLSTFGLISRGKGIEYALKAIPKIKEKYPNVLYLVLGETHPGVRNNEGESYRKELLQIVSENNIEDNVRFNNKYLDMKELIDYLNATDIYITPYINRDQIVSGTLAYALGCGKAIISTKYLYAESVLSNGRGILVDFRNPDQIADAAISILSNPQIKSRMESLSYAYGKRSKWFNVAIDYLDLFHRLCTKPEVRREGIRQNKAIEARDRKDGR